MVECKLWRNPQARREVVGQILDYAGCMRRWSYSDLQRQVSTALGASGNMLYEKVRARFGDTVEHMFVEQTTRALRQGNFLLIIAGDGIKEDVSAIAELINQNAGARFGLGLVEIGLFGMDGGGLIIQPRVLVKTTIIERVVYSCDAGTGSGAGAPPPLASTVRGSDDAVAGGSVHSADTLGESPRQAAFRKWWQPVLDMSFDDPEQEPAKLYWPNYVKAALPWPKSSVHAYRVEKDRTICVCLSCPDALSVLLEPAQSEILGELPRGTVFGDFMIGGGLTFGTARRYDDFRSEDEKRTWVIATMRQYSNCFRPRIVRLMRELETAN